LPGLSAKHCIFVIQQLVPWTVEASLGVRRLSTAVLATDAQSRDDVHTGMRWMQSLLCAASETTVAVVASVSTTSSRRFVAICTAARSRNGYWHHNVVCLSLHPLYPIVLLHAVGTAIGIIMSSVCLSIRLSICKDVYCGARARCSGLKVVPSCS